jgi:hypothetical protein
LDLLKFGLHVVDEHAQMGAADTIMVGFQRETAAFYRKEMGAGVPGRFLPGRDGS